jgi:NifU-like protein involved in Fe-S cluster formation
MIETIYDTRILELAGNIPRVGRLTRPDATATAHSKLCGSTVTVDLSLRDGKIADYAHELRACALGQASASILARNIIGVTPAELRGARDALRALLKEDAPPPDGKWAALAVLEPVRAYKARHASTLLAFDAAVEAVNKIELTNAPPEKNERETH